MRAVAQERQGARGTPGRGGRGRGRCRRSAGYTLLELHVTLVILAIGLLSLPPLMAMQSRQVRHVEAWCRSEPTFYLLGSANRWLRRLGAAAEVSADAAATAWAPPVSGPHAYDVELQSLTEDLDHRAIVVSVKHKAVE